LKEEALDCTMWRARFGRGFGPVVRQTTKSMDDDDDDCGGGYYNRRHSAVLKTGCVSCLDACLTSMG
jgi:hypothetical protein